MDKVYRTKGGILLPRPIVERPPAFVDLFAGCGGFSLGMEAAGIDVVAAVENDCNAASSYLYNLGNPIYGCVVGYTSDEYAQKFRRHLQSAQKAAPTIRRQPTLGDHGWIGCNRRDQNKDQGARAFILGDVRDVCGEDIIELLEMHGWTGKLNDVIGGPPCQGFSKASGRSKKTRATDPRNNLVLEHMRIVGELGVETFVMVQRVLFLIQSVYSDPQRSEATKKLNANELVKCQNQRITRPLQAIEIVGL